MQTQGTTVDVAGVLPERSRPVVFHANRSALADRDGNESPATAVAVVCPPRTHCALWALLPHPRVRWWGSSGSAAWGPRAGAGVLVALVTAVWGNQCDLRVVYMVTMARTQRRR
jgi:hypothetical protein